MAPGERRKKKSSCISKLFFHHAAYGLLVSAELEGRTSEGSSYHALWVRDCYAAEELVGAEHLLVPGNKIPFEQGENRIKSNQNNWLLLQCLLRTSRSPSKAGSIQENT